MESLLWLLVAVIRFYFYVILVGVVLSWLVAGDVVNLRNRFVRMIYDVTNALMEPALRPIRRILPVMGGLDLSPIVLVFLLMFLERLLIEYWPHYA